MKRNKFQYQPSVILTHWGIHFDSMLELKFAISVQREYECLRSPVSIYFDPATKKLYRYPRSNLRRYTPDFLIRNKISEEAWLVEVKPDGFSDFENVDIRYDLATRYIKRMGYDWKFKTVFGNEIILDTDQLVQFNECCRYFLSRRNRRSVIAETPLVRSLNTAPSGSSVLFALYGSRRASHLWK